MYVTLDFTLWVYLLGHSGFVIAGDIQMPGTDRSLPALPGLEYPDPGGSGLSVPVLGAQLDWQTGRMVPLAGTMEDAEGKGNALQLCRITELKNCTVHRIYKAEEYYIYNQRKITTNQACQSP